MQKANFCEKSMKAKSSFIYRPKKRWWQIVQDIYNCSITHDLFEDIS